VHLTSLKAALNHDRDSVYHAAYLDPHTSAELPLDTIRKMCDELIKAHEMDGYFKTGKNFSVPKMWGI
jgi:alpha-galactosidase/6-phospho-beta-glucosidase family protein